MTDLLTIGVAYWSAVMRAGVLLLIGVVVIIIAGCAGQPKEHVRCTVKVQRDAGMGVKVESCAVWQIGAKL